MGKRIEQQSRPLLLGHRGARAVWSIPENTLPSFDRALADGCDGFEFDVRMSADGEAVICHDPQSRELDIARSQARQLHWLPRLEDVVAQYQDRAFLDIELKISGLERATIELAKKHPPKKGYVISSFLRSVLQALRAADAGIPLGLICETKEQLRGWKELGVDYVIPRHDLVNRDLVRRIEDAGKKILVWTVNDPADMLRLKGWGLDGIISDSTDVLCQTIGE
ncbi:MAG TPA: glycerophosphodiester phosphodiesterase [Verrucomicrobiae bacterium]|jgi:glycerophosphoryl diester phosphodiesterase|nr:glycerophosphodiester phosphodiesterase [Verrucomicrobiae bacterium]